MDDNRKSLDPSSHAAEAGDIRVCEVVSTNVRVHARSLSYHLLVTDISRGRKFFGHPNGSKSKPQQSTLAFKENSKPGNTQVPVQNGVGKQKFEKENQDSDSDQPALSTEERDSSSSSKGDDEILSQPDIVSKGLSNDESG